MQAQAKNINNFNGNFENCENVIIMLENGKKNITQSMLRFINEFNDQLTKRKIVVVIVLKDGRKNENEIKFLRQKFQKSLISIEMVNFNNKKIVEKALNIKEIFAKKEKEEEINVDICEFLEDKEILTIAATFENKIIQRAVEFVKIEENFYLFLETGEIFSNLIFNNSVSLFIFEELDYFLEITGNCFLLENNSEEYKNIIEIRLKNKLIDFKEEEKNNNDKGENKENLEILRSLLEF